MPSFYIASRLENIAQVQELRDLLHAAEWECLYDWTIHGSIRGPEAGERLRRVSVEELGAASDADVVVVLLPGGRGTHVELGAALASHDPTVVVWSPDPDRDFGTEQGTCAFYHHPRITRRADVTTAGLAAWSLTLYPRR